MTTRANSDFEALQQMNAALENYADRFGDTTVILPNGVSKTFKQNADKDQLKDSVVKLSDARAPAARRHTRDTIA